LNEFIIIREIRKFFATAEYELQNVFIWDWESDYFCITTSGYSIEVEVKISKSDFKADQKKAQKHFILKNIHKELVTMPVYSYLRDASAISIIKPKGPNKFYYCCPEGMIKPDEVPDYAGLLYFTECPDDANEHMYHSIKQIKPAKFLHKNKPDLSKILLDKYYYLYLDLKHQYRILKQFAEELQSKFKPDYDINLKNKHLDEPKYYEPKLFD
jgi:hypothetical protein